MPLVSESGALTQSRPLARDVQLYYLAEYLTESLIYFMLVFSPWAFGTTEPWSIWTMNVCGYALGLLLIVRWMARDINGYRPARWGEEAVKAERAKSEKLHAWLTTALGMLTLAILLYCLIAALNPRATFNPASQSFDYQNCLPWLPHSFDSRATWDTFWRYSALACSFWAVRDWLLGKSMDEQRVENAGLRRVRARGLQDAMPCRPGPPTGRSQPVTLSLPLRLRRLLWVLIISGGLLALEGIAQRLSASPKLLFLLKPEINQNSQTQFASYAYRANAAQYFNLLWPVALGFWWLLHRSGRANSIACRIPLVSAVVMAACPIISSARGAALVDAAMLFVAALLLLMGLLSSNFERGRRGGTSALWVMSFLIAAFALGLGLGWKQLRPRMNDFAAGMQERELLYERARPIARDYALFGTGPGTFDRVFQLYRLSPDIYWPAQLHNDWLETRLTFGWFGSALIALALGTVLVRGFVPGGIPMPAPFILLMWLALGGCLVQARWDFPLQIPSILFLFLVWCAVLFASSRNS
jgi:hypothetical protein